MEAERISGLAGGRAPLSYLFLSFVRVCVFLRKARRRRFSEDGIEVSPSSPRSGDVCSIIGGRVEVCLRRICLWWICSGLFVVRLRSCVFRLDPFDLHSSSATVVVLVRWFFGALARRLFNSLLQQSLPGSGEGGAMAAACRRLASVLVVVARWFTNLDIFVISVVRCTAIR